MFSGDCELAIRPAADIAAPDWSVLSNRWDAWLTAIDAGMFPPGEVAASPDQLASGGSSLTVRSVPAVAFRVLNGMLGQFSAGWARLECWSLRDPRTGVNLLNADAAFPGPPPGSIALPLEIDPRRRHLGFRVIKNLSIVIEFTHAIDTSSRETIARTLEAWMELLNGGYPLPGYPPEESGAVGTVRFLEPSTVAVHMEFVQAAPESTTPLIHLLNRWRRRFPIERAYVE